MKSKIMLLLTIVSVSLFTTANVFAADAKIVKDNVKKGIVTVTTSTPSGLKVRIENGSNIYDYDVYDKSTNYPLQMGAGKYKITVLQRVEGTKYKALASESIDVPKIDDKVLYANSIQLVNYNGSMQCIKDISPKVKSSGAKGGYEYMVGNFSYDFDKAKTVKAGYVPSLESVYKAKKGICFDYSSLLAGSLRYNNIPTKLVMGYAPDVKEYHAWNQVLIDGKWVTVDTTADSQYAKAKAAYSMAKDASKYKVVKVY